MVSLVLVITANLVALGEGVFCHLFIRAGREKTKQRTVCHELSESDTLKRNVAQLLGINKSQIENIYSRPSVNLCISPNTPKR